MEEQLERVRSALSERYQIERELGYGGMATVYLATEHKHKRHLAVKVLKPELAATIGKDRFLLEISTMASLSHPHILPLFDSGFTDDFVYYVMPFVEGESLRERIKREKQLPIEDALQITNAVASALGFAHSRGIVHRDIKPENILLEAGHPIVADFGIARAVSASGGERLTETGLAIGTPQYMSPEQAMGDQEVDGRSDQYSLACVLYEMLVGDPPFAGSVAQAILRRKSVEKAPTMTAVRETIPRTVDRAVAKALCSIPADRYRVMEGFVAALKAEDGSHLDRTPTVGETPGVITGHMAFAPMAAEFNVYGLTHPGKLDTINKDHFLLGSLTRHLNLHFTSLTGLDSPPERLSFIAAVASGEGRGLKAPEASSLVIETIAQYMLHDVKHYRPDPDDTQLAKAVEDAVTQSHAALAQRARQNEASRGMASALTLAVAAWPNAYLVNVGDGRMYHWLNGELTRMTEDHAGEALGKGQPAPVVVRIDESWRSRILLCSHGLTKHVSDERIGEVLERGESAKNMCEVLLQEALDAGGTENITIIVGYIQATDWA